MPYDDWVDDYRNLLLNLQIGKVKIDMVIWFDSTYTTKMSIDKLVPYNDC